MTMVIAESIFHTFDPFAVKFPVGWPIEGIRWYGLSYAVGFVLAWLVVRWVARKPWSPLSPAIVGDLMFAVILGVLLGGRLGYAIFYDPSLFIGVSNSFPFWDLLAINKGGMASHGGMIGVILACVIFARRRDLSALHILDIGALGCSPGLFLGRIANFINAELWGKPLHVSVHDNPPWWSVKYPEQITERWLPLLRSERLSHHESMELVARNAADFGISAPAGDLPSLVLTQIHSRLEAIEQQLGPQIGVDDRFFERVAASAKHVNAELQPQIEAALQPLLTPYYPSQLIQAVTDGPLLFGILAVIWIRPRKPGVIGSWFLIVYGLLRILSEAFRQPDEGVQLLLGLSRGQLLSVLMVVAGTICLAVTSRRSVMPLGGLFRRA